MKIDTSKYQIRSIGKLFIIWCSIDGFEIITTDRRASNAK